MDNEDLPRQIISEFDKVLIELIKIKNENKDLTSVSFDFCGRSYRDPIFNYELLEKYLLNKVDPMEHYIV